MTVTKTFAALLLTLASTSAFAMGNTDTKIIQPKLDEAKEAGFECQQVWPRDWGQTSAGGTFKVAINCKHASGAKKSGTIVFKADSNLGARCRDISALSIDLDLK